MKSSKKKGKVLNFKNTFMSWQLWVSSFSYHFLVLILDRIISKRTVSNLTESVYSPPVVIQSSPVTAAIQSTSLYRSYDFSILINLILFDLIFAATFLLFKRSKLKHYNLWAVILAAFLTTLFFQLCSRLLAANIRVRV